MHPANCWVPGRGSNWIRERPSAFLQQSHPQVLDERDVDIEVGSHVASLDNLGNDPG